ncbi:MAG: hypothetical protein KC613_10715, partial [Myxococcales bacterium]|nr:hypothetical protein [Myxococcales bacterium]
MHDWQPYAGDAWLDWPALEAWCRALAASRPETVALHTLGTTAQGRPILLLTLGRIDGHEATRPAFWLDGGTHAAEWTGIMATLYAVSRWVARLDADDPWFHDHSVHVVPCVSPDGFAALMAGEPFLRSTLRPPPPGRVRSGLDPCDLDGDGKVRWMRWRHPAGSFVQDPELPLFMRPRTLEDDPADAWFVCPEGELVEWDGARWVQAPLKHGLDLNRNFPGHWAPFEMFGMDGGAWPGSAPESEALLKGLAARPGVAVALTNHTYTGAILTQPYRADGPLGDADLFLMERLAKQAVAGTGWRAVRVHPDFTYDAKK